MDNSLDIAALKKFIESNPNLMNQVVGYKKPGRKAGTKVPKEPVVVETEAPEVEEISYHKAKQMGIIKRKPRNLSDESKAKMLENLARGREALKQYQESRRKEKEQVKEQEINREVKKKIKEISVVQDETKPTKKYLVKPPKKQTKQRVPLRSDSDEDESETEDFTTESETTDVETKKVKKRLAKKAAVLKTIDQQLSKIPPPTALSRQSKYGNLF